MTIPPPRKFFEIAAFCFLGLCTMVGMIGAIVLMLVLLIIERIVDKVRWLRRRA